MKVGFIGAGNMAKAILAGMHKSNVINKKDVFVSNKTKEKLVDIDKKYGYYTSIKNDDVIEKSKDVIFLCIKPQVFDEIKNELKKSINKNQIIVTIIAGKTLDYLEKSLGTKNIIRVMPNTPCLVGAGICSITATSSAKKDKRYDEIINILKNIGETVEVDEKYVNAITQISGASPAWIFMFIEALADGGVLCGMPRDLAYKFASNAVMGSGKLAVEKNVHPGILKDMVTSPAGTTIEGVKVLEEKGFRGAVIDAVNASYQKSIKL